MMVTRADLERCIERVRATVRDPRAGLHGPGSVSWRVGREGVLMLAGGATALLQLAHPFVGQGVSDHSATCEDTVGRFLRTFHNVHAMAFGTLDQAIASARRVHAIHERVTGVIPEAAGGLPAGTPYAANDGRALLWVNATLVANSVRTYELVVGPLTPLEREAYYEENRVFAYLFGISDDLLPANWAAFERYYEGMIASGALAASRPARELAAFLLRPPHPALQPMWRWYTMMTAVLLPPGLREGFGLGVGEREERWFDTSIRALRPVYARLPGRLRYMPAYVAAERRMAGRTDADLFQRVITSAMYRAMRTPSAARPRGGCKSPGPGASSP